MEKKGLRVRYLKNHIIICGWNTRVPGIIRDLTGPYVPERKRIIVIAEMDDEYPLQDYKFNPNYVFYCRGESSSLEILKKAHLQNADKVLVMAGQKKLASENIRSVLTTLAVKNFYKDIVKDKGNGKKISVFAELIFEKNKRLFDLSQIDKLVSLDVIREKFATEACINKGVTDLLLDLLTHNERDNLYSIFVKDLKEPIREEILGKTFSDILVPLRKKNILLLAIYKHIDIKHGSIETSFRKDSPYIINPTNEERDYKVDLNDKLIYIAETKNAIQKR
ncbi:MAG: hypothetical protein AB1414_11885 [bacterium]